MQKFINSIAASSGSPVSGASVQVNTWPAGAPATIYSDNGVTVAANPMTTDTNGAFSFYAADGHYQLVISGTNIQTQTINDILLVDHFPADLPTTLPASSGVVWNNGGTLSIS
ncbi:carboxypeptidase regulatory-like domain-containing protein [Paraburkholderia sp. JPY303]|uniref:carboxypeptidase-like regulatory domain-containing protein n=1 Tax=Paraburkholderia atlantica TaxID=2654982 RepID=UPI0015922422|nr:carboxypeptidase-like regulatory domain-containing protein [Paraburkholderia atlantica]NUY33293.1 carboxypeptidase regulatory-like domain-containing protein [Paraburkholderia atlantica]